MTFSGSCAIPSEITRTHAKTAETSSAVALLTRTPDLDVEPYKSARSENCRALFFVESGAVACTSA